MPEKLTKIFSYAFSGNIWRILTELGENLLVTEIREGAGRKVSFAAIDLHTCRLLWQDLMLEESWWVSAVLLHRHQLYLQTYPDSQTPQPKGLVTVDVQSGKVIWQNSHLNFLRLTSNGLLTYETKEDEVLYQLLSPDKGTLKEALSQKQASRLPAITPAQATYPVHYTEENKYFRPIVQFLYTKLQIQPSKAFDYIEYNQLIIISYYIYSRNTYTNFLLVLDQESNILLHEILAKDLSGIGMDTFFIANNRLIFIREKKELIIYEL